MINALEKVHKAGLKFLVPLTPEETYKTIVHEAIKLVGGDGGAVYLEENSELHRVYRWAPGSTITKVRKRGFTRQAFTERRAFVVNFHALKLVHPEVAKSGIRSSVFIPLSYRNKSIGVLTVRSYKSKRFPENELSILKLFGSMASLAIRKTQLYDEARKALEIRDLFLSMAAHEFRTPLTTISGYVQLLANKFPKNLSPQLRWVEELSWETNRLTSLVNELLEVSRIKDGQFQYIWRECSVTKVIERAIDEFNFSHPSRKVNFDSKVKMGQDIVIGDFDKLLQVLTNLLDNAAKFSPAEKEILIRLKIEFSGLGITVKDSGKGIDKKELPRIFEGFYQGRVAVSGMGLGLFLSKTIIAQHHGEISVSSKVSKGTVVKVSLPRIKL